MVGIGGCSITHKLRQNLCPPLFRMGELLQNNNTGTFSQHKTGTVFVKGNRSAKGIRVRAQSREVRKSGYPGGADGSLSSSSQADVRISVLDRPEGIPDAVSSGGAGRHHIRAFSSGSQSDGDVSRRHI